MSGTPGRLADLSPERRAMLQKLMLRRAAAQPDAREIRPRGEAGPAPLSFAQQRLWFLDQMEPGNPAYNIPLFLRLRGRLDAASLRRALGEIVRRHEALRTRFTSDGGEPAQQVDPPAPVPLPLVELGGLAEWDRERETRRLMLAESSRPFDLARGPLLRALLLRRGEEEHVLSVSQHHVVSDGWSMGIFTREMSALYGAFAAGRPSPLPEPALQYADYAVWQRGWLTGETLDVQLAWWTERLAGAPPLLELPVDRPRGALRGTWSAAAPFELRRDAADALRALAGREEATPFVAVLAAWQLLLARHAGRDDVVVGTPIAGRTRVELEGIFGFFVNTLAIRTDLSGEPTFRELLRRVRETMLGAHQHQDLPFERLVESLGIERSLTHAPLFQVMFSLDDGQPGEAEPRLGPLEAEPLGSGAAAVKFDLSLSLGNRGGALAGRLTFRADLWDRATAERMLERFGRLLEQVAADPDRRTSEVDLLGPAERERVLAEWNATDAPFSDGALLHELVEEQARRRPDAPALSHGSRTLTYAELDRAADALAHGLVARGVAPETRVALFFEPAAEMVVALLAVLKAGGAYVPLDTGSPPERLAWVLADSGARLVLTQAALADRLPDFGGEVVALDGTPLPPAPSPARGEGEHDRSQSGAAVAGCSLFPVPCSLSLAYVIYTSGSTGRPKGVLVPHRGVCNSTEAFVRAYGIRPGSRVLLFAPLHFDASVLDVFTALCSGATLVLASRDELMPGEGLTELLRRERVTHLKITPSALAVTPRAELPELEAVMVGGETCGAELVARWAPGRRFFNGYGATEHSVRCTVMPCTDGGRPPPVGRPIANARLYVLDAHLQPVPAGLPGEVYMAGLPVTRGYLGLPGLTAERFLPDPFRGEPGARMYRSGDRGRWLEDGTLEFVGRTDFQLKVRGFRIEPGEVEAALLAHPALADAVVVARGETAEERHLAAYVVARGGAAAPGAAELREHLRARLPEYMVPSALAVMEALPLTPNGKVDRRALPDPGTEPADGAADGAPATPTEEVLAGIFATVLRAERVGRAAGFFALGGHSLAATVVASRVRRAFGVELPLRAIFEAPTVAGLAERVDALLRDGTGAALPPILPAPRAAGPHGGLPLSFAQQRLWFIEQLDPGAGRYDVVHAMRLRGPLDPAALARALAEVVRRHETLRTTFGEAGGVPFQVVHPAAASPLRAADLSRLPAGEREAGARRLVLEEARIPFDLRRGPLLRARLVRLAAEEHVLVLAMHHVVSDGWSMGVLFREAAALYEAFTRGEASPLPELPVQYADFAAWQRAWLAGETRERQLAWWRELLRGAPPVLEIPVDRPRRAVPGGATATVVRELSGGLPERVRAFARAEGATLYMVLLAVLDVVLARWSGGDDVVVGTPIANRTQRETEALIGFFVNTLALRADVSGSPAFRGLLERVRETTLGAYQHQDVPFEWLVEELGVERSLSHTPLFQVMFSMDDGAGSPEPFGGIEVDFYPVGRAAGKFDLTVSVVDGGEELLVGMSYREALWDASTLERVVDAYVLLLDAAVSDPGRRITELPLATEAERARVLAEWSRGPAAPAPLLAVHEMIAEQAARTPDSVAVAFEDGSLTYAQLEARAGGLAARLRGLGVAPGARVGICLERSPVWVVAVLAVLQAGGAYVPLDPAHPPARLAQVLRDADARLLLTEACLRGRLPAEGVEEVLLDGGTEYTDTPAHSRTFALSHSSSPDDLAYVVYTSGSTGAPKGVMVDHRGLAATVLAAREAFGFAPGATFGVLASPAFDIWAFEALLPLAVGGTARIVPREHVRDVARLAGEVERMDVLHAVPALMAELVRAAREERADFSRVRRVFVGGEAVPPELVEEMRGAFPAARLHVLYGPTEGTIICASHAVPGAGGAARRMLGAPLPGAALYVCDAAGGVLPAAFPGELCIGGPGVARGYLGRPDLTAERFVPDPFGGVPGARLYRTGDRARWLEDGELEFLGRTDAQVKIRGFRIEPGEVEAALAAHPGVHQAVVVAREHPAGGLRLAAHAVPRPGAAPVTGAELREWLRDRLPDYMVPAAVLVAESLPLTPTGKVDRRALPAPDPHTDHAETSARLPATPTEEVVAAVWADVLGVPRVGPGDNFFELGGHSLLATQVVARLREAFGAEVPVRAVFETPTPAGLAAAVDAVLRAGRGTTLPPLVRADRSGPLPLSFAQQRLWVIDRMDPGSPAYNMSVILRLRGALDAAALRSALDALVERHESLRTVFPAGDGGPVQAVLPAAGAPLAVDPLHGVPGDSREAEALRRAREEAGRPFDLAAGPLFRPVLLRVADDHHLLVLAQHHVVTDGWSMGVLFRELGALYAASGRGGPPPLPELPVQYADYAVWQRGWLAGETLERQVAYWRDALAGAPPLLELPTDRPRSGARSAAGAPHRFPLPAAAVDGIRAAARAEGATLFMALLAAWQLLLSRCARQDDVVVGTAIAGRTHQALEGLVGMFVNTLAIRSDLSGDPSFRGLLGRVRERTLGAYAHQDLPFEKLVDELHPVRDVTHPPVFQATFALQNAPGGGPELPGLEVSPVAPEGRTAKFDLSLAVVEGADGLYGVLEYAADLFDAGTALRMAGHLRTLLAGLAAAPDAPLSDAVLLDAAERRRVLSEWSGGEAPRPAAWVPVHERVLARAAETPGAVALVCGARRVTYGELDARSAELAGRLRARGVGPETRVALLVERSPERVVGMLAVLRAGGAYLPLDPATPPERLAGILEDAGAALVLDRRGLSAGPGGTGTGGVGAGVSPDGAAYVVYTSGSTGTPKGVVVTHGGLASLVDWHLDAFGVTAADRVTQLTGLGFDASVQETWPQLAAGATLHLVADEEARTSSAALQRFMLEHRITLAFVPTPLAEGLLALEWPDAAALRVLLAGGDVLRVRPRAGLPFQLVNGYGPTENTVVATTGVVQPGGGDARAPAIGRPIAGVRAYVLDPALGPVPAGVPGELCLGGRSVARGYLGRPGATAAAFVPDPFAGEAGARMYRTGDLVRWLENGELEFLGRIDRQVKVRGFRIEPGEIEAVLLRHPGVRGAAVLVRQGPSGRAEDRRIVAYLEADGGVSPRDARELARASLPQYMVPAAFLVLDALPLTPSGKVDRGALPAPEPSGAAGEDGAEPRTELERTIAAVWKEVLGVPEVGIAASFFDLGGNSLLVVRAAERLEAALGRRVPVLDLFRHGTVAALARHLSGAEAAETVLPPDEGRPSRLAAGKGRLHQLRKRKDAGG